MRTIKAIKRSVKKASKRRATRRTATHGPRVGEKVVVVFGAGATKACGGPLTNEILPDAYAPKVRAEMERDGYNDVIQREGYADLLDEFLVNSFHVPRDRAVRNQGSYPGLPLLLSLIDTAIDRKEPLGPRWVPERIPEGEAQSPRGRRSLTDLRQSLEYIVFALLDYKLRRLKHNYYRDLLKKLYPPGGPEPDVISLNYDLIADNSLIRLSGKRGRFPDYGCEISTTAYNDPPNYYGRLLKIHGSLNWLYCPGCHRLDIGVSENEVGTVRERGEGEERYTFKVLDKLYQESKLKEKYRCTGSPCPECSVFVRPVLITPTHKKDYRNPHIARIWHQAERMLRDADHVIFVGYSLPEDDVEVIYLLKRGVIKPGRRVTVVEYDKKRRRVDNHPVGARYKSLFGEVEWHNGGFEKYVAAIPS